MSMELLKILCHWAIIIVLVNVTVIHSKEETTQAPDAGNQTATSEDSGTTKDPRLTGDPRHDYIYDPNLPRELNGYDLGNYPFYSSVPTDITFKCDGRHDGYYASIPHHCQLFHLCVHSLRHDFLCANYTVFDQTQFICHFVNSVNCSNSESYYDRNNELYVTTTTEIPEYDDEYEEEPRTKRPRRRKSRRRKGRRRTTTPPPDEYYDYYEEEEEELPTEEVAEETKPAAPARRSRTTTTTTIATLADEEAPKAPKVRRPRLRQPRPIPPPSTALHEEPTDQEQALPTENLPAESRTSARSSQRVPPTNREASRSKDLDVEESAIANSNRPTGRSQFQIPRGSVPSDVIPDATLQSHSTVDEPPRHSSRGSVNRQANRNVASVDTSQDSQDIRERRPLRVPSTSESEVLAPRTPPPQRRVPEQSSSIMPDPLSVVAGILSGFNPVPSEKPVEVPLKEEVQPSQVPGRQANRRRQPVPTSSQSDDRALSISAEGVVPDNPQEGSLHSDVGPAAPENNTANGKRRVQRRRKIRKKSTTPTPTTTTTTTTAPLHGEYEYEYVE